MTVAFIFDITLFDIKLGGIWD